MPDPPTHPLPVDTDHLRRMAAASVFGIPDPAARAYIVAAADELDRLRAQARLTPPPVTW